jgi:hypothetical protein
MPTFEDYQREGENEGPKPFDTSPPVNELQREAMQGRQQQVREGQANRANFGAPEMPPAPQPQMDPRMDPRMAGADPRMAGGDPRMAGGDPRVGDAQMAAAASRQQYDYQQPTGDRVPQRHEQSAMNSIRNPNFDNPIAHLEQAKAIMGAQGIRAAEREYFSAIRAADNIDQREVAQERQAIRQQLQVERDAAKRRELVQYDSTLHDMQRAPGFTRANLAFAYMASGYQSEGVKLLMEASRLDPEMERDPNFIRHLRSFDRRPQQGYQPGMQGADGQYSPQGQRGPPGTYRPDTPGTAGDQPYTPPQYAPGAPGTTGDRQTGTPQTGATGDQTTGVPQTGATGDQTTGAPRTQGDATVTIPSGNNRPDAANYDNPDEHLAKANEAFAKGGNKLTPEARAEYDKAIATADALDRNFLLQHYKDLETEYNQKYPQDVQDKIKGMAAERDALKEKLPADTKKQLGDLETKLGTAKTDQERAAILAQMEKLAPEVFKKDKEIGDLTKRAEEIELEMVRTAHLLNAPSLMRYALASALAQSGDKEGAKKYLDESVKMNPDAMKDEQVVKLAEQVGLKLEKPAETPASATNDKTGEALVLLQQAQQVEKEKGFAEAKPIYEKAIASADELMKNGGKENLQKSFDQLKTKLEDKTLSDEDKQKVAALMTLCAQLQHAPYLTRLNYAVALNNSGDQANAKKFLDQAGTLDPEMAKSESFKKAMEVVGKPGTKTTIEELSKADDEAAKKDIMAGDPLALVSQATDAAKKGNLKSAEELYKKSIEAADKLDMTRFKAGAAENEKLAKEADAAGDFAKANMYRELQKQNELYTKLPYLARQELAEFYNQVQKGDESKAMLDQAIKINPNLKDDPTYRKDLADATELSKGAFEKGVDYMKHMGKQLLVDGGSGVVGLAVSAMLPERAAILRIVAGVGAGGVAHYGLSNYVVGEKSSLGNSMLWGGVDAAAFMAGGAVHEKMMGRFSNKVGSAEAFTALAEKNLLKGEAITALEGARGVKLLDGVAATVTGEVAARKTAADEARNLALKDMPIWKSLPLRIQSHTPIAWRFGSQDGALASWRALEKDYMAAQGSKFQYLNPASLFNPTGASNLRQLEARAMWNRLAFVDAPAMATTSAVFHAPHEAVKIGSVDESGHRYSAYDAVTNFGKNVTVDTATGMFTLGFARQMGGHLFKHSGIAGEVNPLKPPTPLPEGAGLWSKAGQGKRWMGYGIEKYIGKPIGDGFNKVGTWTANPEAISNPFLQAAARGGATLPTSMQIDAQAFYKGYALNKTIEEQEKIMEMLQRPLEDAYPERPAATDTTTPAATTPAPAERTTTAPTTDKPAAGSDKPANQGGAAPQPGSGLPE